MAVSRPVCPIRSGKPAAMFSATSWTIPLSRPLTLEPGKPGWGGDNLVEESLWQTISVPAGVNGLQVRYWWRIDTFEPTHPFDTLDVQIRNGNGTPLQTLETLSDGDAGSQWQQSTFTLSGYAGQTIQLVFVAHTDGTRPTSFFLDDVSVAKACPTGLAGDVTGDCLINILDIAEAAANIGAIQGSSVCYSPAYDLVYNGVIDSTDLRQMSAHWRQTSP